MEIFDNTFTDPHGTVDDLQTALLILGQSSKATKKEFFENLNPEDKFAQQLKVVDQEYAKAIAAKEAADTAKAGEVKP